MHYIIDKEKVHMVMRELNISTQKELADKIGITKNQLSVMLSNNANPLKNSFSNLCTALKVSPVELLIKKESKRETTEKKSNNAIEYIDTTNVVPRRTFNSVELFAGGGGLALGLEKAGFNAKGLVEIDKYAAQTLRDNRPAWNVIEEDIVNVTNDGIKNYLPGDCVIDFVSGGYPCQAFSYAGHKLGLEDVRGTMFYYFAQIVDQLQPTIFSICSANSRITSSIN